MNNTQPIIPKWKTAPPGIFAERDLISMNAQSLIRKAQEGADLKKFCDIHIINKNINHILHFPLAINFDQDNIQAPCEVIFNLYYSDYKAKWQQYAQCAALSAVGAMIGGTAGYYKIASKLTEQSPLKIAFIGAVIGTLPGLLYRCLQSRHSTILRKNFNFCSEGEHFPKGSTGCNFMSNPNLTEEKKREIANALKELGHVNGNAFIPQEVIPVHKMNGIDGCENKSKNGYLNTSIDISRWVTPEGDNPLKLSPHGPFININTHQLSSNYPICFLQLNVDNAIHTQKIINFCEVESKIYCMKLSADQLDPIEKSSIVCQFFFPSAVQPSYIIRVHNPKSDIELKLPDSEDD